MLSPWPARAQEPLLARVLAIEPTAITLTIDPPGGGASETRVVPLDERERPAGLRVGSLVRLWPGPTGLTPDTLMGARIDSLNAQGRLQDRTGVRARLMQGAQRGADRAGGRGGR
ncbi:hypothetical protein [Allochromatium palmeri]|uniref:Uncharacterized protein n=1 Tax=Allochromatium palmeri TaxID=231048 RepID=A0A6N8EAG3_9GAMM|nr:hypothetical protein [Allochromatium palmeri]MTW20541.1 hypothetical protein [Allochromatium palmeri]